MILMCQFLFKAQDISRKKRIYSALLQKKRRIVFIIKKVFIEDSSQIVYNLFTE